MPKRYDRTEMGSTTFWEYLPGEAPCRVSLRKTYVWVYDRFATPRISRRLTSISEGGSAQSAKRKSLFTFSLLFSSRAQELIPKIFPSDSLVAEMKFRTEYPEVEKSILDLIPYTNGKFLCSFHLESELMSLLFSWGLGARTYK